jgi:outer membrane lipoprotein-sorting protein
MRFHPSHAVGMAVLLALALPLPARASESDVLLNRWLEAQAGMKTWTADVTQTRTLKALAQPLTASGRVWYSAPSRFRWELGDPPRTIAIRQPDELLVVYPALKRAERYPLADGRAGQWRDALTLLEAGFPQTRNELEARFALLETQVGDAACLIRLQPKSSAARRMITEIQIAFSVDDLVLRSTQLHFADGSTMRNDFENPVMNPPIDPELFRIDLPADYKTTEPLKP